MENIDKLAEALSIAQGAFENPAKDRENPFFHSRYVTLDALQNATRKALSENGLSVIQRGNSGPDGSWVLVTTLLHSSGQSLAGSFPLYAFAKGPQAAGSEITYMRRYAYAAILNITADEDDDANGAQNAIPASAYRETPKSVTEDLRRAVTGQSNGDITKEGVLGEVKPWETGDGWSTSVGAFGGKRGESVWTKNEDLANALAKYQGQPVVVHLRSKKAGSYQVISFLPGEPV